MALERERSRLQAEFLQREEGLRARLQEVRCPNSLSQRHTGLAPPVMLRLLDTFLCTRRNVGCIQLFGPFDLNFGILLQSLLFRFSDPTGGGGGACAATRSTRGGRLAKAEGRRVGVPAAVRRTARCLETRRQGFGGPAQALAFLLNRGHRTPVSPSYYRGWGWVLSDRQTPRVTHTTRELT